MYEFSAQMVMKASPWSFDQEPAIQGAIGILALGLYSNTFLGASAWFGSEIKQPGLESAHISCAGPQVSS